MDQSEKQPKPQSPKPAPRKERPQSSDRGNSGGQSSRQDRSDNRSGRSRGRGGRRGGATADFKKWSNKPGDAVRRSFFACPRCSFFYSGVRALIGIEELTARSMALDEGVLTLEWSYELRQLVERNYALEIHSDTFHFAGCCKECGRAFQSFSDPDSAEIVMLQIQADRHAGQLR